MPEGGALGYVGDVKLALVVFLVGCGGGAATTTSTGGSGKLAIRWGGQNHFASDWLTIAGGGHVDFVYTEAGGKTDRWSGQLTDAEMKELVDVIAAQQLCTLVSDPAYTPVPDESQTSLTIDLAGRQCTVSLWDNEWDKHPRGSVWRTTLYEVTGRFRK